MLDNILDNIQLTRGDRMLLWTLQKSQWNVVQGKESGSGKEKVVYGTTLKKSSAFGDEDVQIFIDKMKHYDVFSGVKYKDNVFYATEKELNNIDIYIHDCV